MSTPTPTIKPAGTGMGALDPAIAERILALLAPKKLAPHKRLVPLLRVNKHWRALALPRLYAAISLKGQWVARPLRKALEGNKALAQLVTELVLDTELSAQDPQETRDHMRIVAACPNLQHLTVLGYASVDLDKYRAALASRAQLVTLNASEGAGMFTFAQLLGMMTGWPKLEKLILKDVLLPAADDDIHPPAPATPCTNLKMVKIIDSLDAAKRFGFPAFAAQAPAVSVLWVQPARTLPADLLDALRLWAPTLEALCLLADSELHLESVLPLLTSLKHLDTHAPVLAPRALAAAPPSLAALTYRVFPAQLLDLAEALAAPGALPALRALEVKGALPPGPGAQAPMQFTPTATLSMRTVCKRRRIRLTM